MLDLLKEIILDFQDLTQEFTWDTGVWDKDVWGSSVPRRIDFTVVPGKATVCMGVRRSGKSTFMLQWMRRLLAEGVARQNILHLNFFDDRLYQLQHQGLAIILEAYFSLYPEKKNKEKIYCFFDEIQIIPGWEFFIERLMRTEKCEVYITGSSAQMLSKEIATQMRGRALSWEMFPFSFREFLDFKAIDSEGPLSTQKRFIIQKAFEEYWQTGGFPEVVGLSPELRIKIHQEYFNAMLFRDLVERHDIAHPKAVIDLARWLVDNTACQYSIRNLTDKYLKESLGHNVPKAAVANYLKWYEDAYVFFTIHIFDASLKRINHNPKKIYCIDHALVTSVNSGILVNSGHLLENLVYIALRRTSPDIFYFKTRTGKEVDFIVQNSDRSRLLVQVCESLTNTKARQREVDALLEAMAELKLEKGIIVTRTEEEKIQLEDKEIMVTPAWRFLLDLSQVSPCV